VTNAIATLLPMHGEAVRRASGFVLVAKGLGMCCSANSHCKFHRRVLGNSPSTGRILMLRSLVWSAVPAGMGV